MATGSSRAVLVLVSLIVGFAAAWLVSPVLPPISPLVPEPRGINVIIVGPRAADLSIPRVRVNPIKEDVLFWASKNRNKQLLIEFDEQPFQNMQRQPNGRFQVECKGRMCFSGEINPAAVPKQYKYWQILVDGAGQRDEVDGQLIIER